jgi:CheY-like chemotaxis protein
MKTLLIVEDEKTQQNALVNFLSSKDYNVLITNSGKDCESILNNETVDLIIMDILMPDQGGIETIHNIKNTDKGKDIPVIVLSNISAPNKIAEALELGVKDYFIKSDITLDKILQKIKEYIPA